MASDGSPRPTGRNMIVSSSNMVQTSFRYACAEVTTFKRPRRTILELLVTGLVFELLGIDAQLTRRKLGKKINPDHGGRQRPTAAMMTPPWLRVIR
jgi:hypothetical protein